MLLKPIAIMALSVIWFPGAVATEVNCTGCSAEAGAGLCNPAMPNNPNANGTTNAPNEANGNGELSLSDITTPPTATDSWKLSDSGNGSAFKSTAGSCQENTDPPSDDGETPLPCKQETSCTWGLKPLSNGNATTLTLKITAKIPAGQGTTAPAVSGNWTQSQTASPSEYTATFNSSDTPMSPGCGGEIEYVATWNHGGGPQRWELSFRCTPCAVATEDDTSGD